MVSRPRAFGALLFAVLFLAVCAILIKIGTDEGRIALQTNAATRPPLSLTPAGTRIASATGTPTPVATIAASVATTPTAASGDIQPSLPIRAAFYYPWYPDAWSQLGIKPYTKYLPALGYYDSSDKSIILRHIAAMQYGHIAAGISSWWGKGDKSDTNFASLLADTAGSTFRWAIYYELESTSNPSVAQLQSDLQYLHDRYGTDHSYLRINGRMVVFVYADSNDNCEMVDRWKQANTVNAYLILKVFAAYDSCANQPDGWHQYAPASATDDQDGYSYAISPGFWKAGEAQPRLPRDLATWYTSIRDMVTNGEPFQLITSFNEWGEGTAIEPANEWASGSGFGQYLDALHNEGEGGPDAVTPQATQPPITAALPNATPTRRPASTPAAGGTRAPARTPLPAGPPPPLFTPAAQPATTGDAILAGAGDIACDPTDPNYNNGLGNANNCREKFTSDILVNLSQQAKIPFGVFVAGDDQYENGALANYQASYDRTWGRLKNLTHPSIGNHEYLTQLGLGYFQYFGDLAGDPHRAYYSYDLGAWHIVVINSNCSPVGGCTTGSPQEVWLKADLAAHPTACALAYWHHPRYSSGQHGSFISMKDIWQDLMDAKAEFVISGHDHNYERFAPQDANGNLDTQNGMRQFIVGTGGKNHTKVNLPPIANSEVQNDKTYGVMKFTLHPNSYDWQFIPEAGKTFTDSGSQTCH